MELKFKKKLGLTAPPVEEDIVVVAETIPIAAVESYYGYGGEPSAPPMFQENYAVVEVL